MFSGPSPTEAEMLLVAQMRHEHAERIAEMVAKAPPLNGTERRRLSAVLRAIGD